MKDTARKLGMYIVYFGKDLVSTLYDFTTVVCSMLLLVLQLIATPLRFIVFFEDRYEEMTNSEDEEDSEEFEVEIEEVSIDSTTT